MFETPIYLFVGFIESGKTSFIKELLENPVFETQEQTLYILCEEGIEKIDQKLLKNNNVTLINLNNETDINKETFEKLDSIYSPERVLIEYNCMWNMEKLNNTIFPEYWELCQTTAIVDSSTFSTYMKNLSSIMVNFFKSADMILFNRCNSDTNKLSLRSGVKVVNPKANIIFKLQNGEIDDSNDVLPFDINEQIIKLQDYDFGIWYEDLNGNPEKYENKEIEFTARTIINNKWADGVFLLTRDAMTCCINDITLLKLICYTRHIRPCDNTWIKVHAIINIKYIKKFNTKVPLLFINDFVEVNKPENDLIYFY